MTQWYKAANSKLSNDYCTTQLLRVFFVEMTMKVVDFDLEVVELVDFEKMEDIDKIEQIPHKDFAYLVPMIEMDFKVGTKVVAKDSNLVGVESSWGC